MIQRLNNYILLLYIYCILKRFKILSLCDIHNVYCSITYRSFFVWSVAHFPGYHFCGPGTQYWERISQGQYGVNKLDEACRSHDLTYTSPDLESRIEADKKLEIQAWNRVTAEDSGYKERIAAWLVTNFMKIQQKWNHSRLQRDVTGQKRKQIYYGLWFITIGSY